MRFRALAALAVVCAPALLARGPGAAGARKAEDQDGEDHLPDQGRRRPLGSRLGGGHRGASRLRDQSRRQHDAGGQDDRPASGTTTSSSTSRSSARTPTSRSSERPTSTATASTTTRTTSGSCSTSRTRTTPRSTSGSGRPASRPTRSSSRGRSTRTSARTTSGSPPDGSGPPPGTPRWRSRCPPCAIPRRIRRTGPSCSTACIRAIATTSSTACACRAARAAFSATRRRSRASPASRRARTGSLAPYGAVTNTKTYRADGLADDDTTTQGQGRPRREVAARTPTRSWMRRSIPTSPRSRPTRRRSRSTSGSRSSIRRSGRSSSSTWTCCRRRSRRSTRARSRQPLWGARLTGKTGGTNFTALVANDEAAERSIIPGPVFSETAPQNYESTVAIARVRQDLGDSFAGVLGDRPRRSRAAATTTSSAETSTGRPDEDDVVNGQYLYSFSQNPDRPDLYPRLARPEAVGLRRGRWSGCTRRVDLGVEPRIRGLRARVSAPTTGSCRRSATARARRGSGYRFFPTGFFSRLRPLAGANYQVDRDGDLISRRYFPGISFQARWSLRGEIDYNFEAVRIAGQTLEFDASRLDVSRPRRRASCRAITFAGNYGEQPDVSNVRVGNGGTLHVDDDDPADGHLALDLIGERQWIDETVDGREGRLFTATVARAKAIYVFNSRMFFRVIGQYIETTRDPVALDVPGPRRRSRSSPGRRCSPTSSTGRPCCIVGYGDNRALFEGSSDLSPAPEPAVPPQSLLRVSAVTAQAAHRAAVAVIPRRGATRDPELDRTPDAWPVIPRSAATEGSLAPELGSG